MHSVITSAERRINLSMVGGSFVKVGRQAAADSHVIPNALGGSGATAALAPHRRALPRGRSGPSRTSAFGAPNASLMALAKMINSFLSSRMVALLQRRLVSRRALDRSAHIGRRARRCRDD